MDNFAPEFTITTEETLTAFETLRERELIVFVSGAAKGYQWGSFSVRGRQVARGLRYFGLKAVAWNHECDTWCKRPSASITTIVVHVKFLCKCAWDVTRPGTLHIYDAIDVLIWSESEKYTIDAAFLQTSLAVIDYFNHPRRKQSTSIFWVPLHESNFERLVIPFRPHGRRVGIHTTHNDTELLDALSAAFDDFVFINPTIQFESTGGMAYSPLHRQEVYKKMAEFDVTVLRHSDCMGHISCEHTREWLCSRYKTGQRLTNAMSMGIPAVIFQDQGFLDVIKGYQWPVAKNVSQAVEQVRQLIANVELRHHFHEISQSLARPYVLENIEKSTSESAQCKKYFRFTQQKRYHF